MERRVRPSWGVLALLIVLFCPLWAASASIMYVNQNTPGAVHDGKSWATAFTAIQPAIDAAASGDEVWVAAGTYTETITLEYEVPVYGGFSGAETTRDQRDWRSNVCVLDGNGNASSSVIRLSVPGVLLDGFTIRHGDTGINVNGTGTVANCIINGNSDAVQLLGGALTVINCIFCRNKYTAVQIIGGTANLSNCTISGNPGGGVSVGHATANISNCVVAFNGWGIYREDNTIGITLSHNDVFRNTTANYTNLADPTGSNGNICADPRIASSKNLTFASWLPHLGILLYVIAVRPEVSLCSW